MGWWSLTRTQITALQIRLAAATLILVAAPGTASGHAPDWISHLLEWLSGKKGAVGDAPSAGWMEPQEAPHFHLVDRNDQGVSLQDLRGKVVLINFMHTGCGDSCSSMAELRLLANTLGGKMGKEVVFISIALDPERDSPEALRAFGQQRGIGSGWELVTGPLPVIEKLTDAFGIYIHRPGGSHTNDHRDIEYTDVILFLDREGRLRKRILPHLLRLSGRRDVEWLLESHHR